MSEGNARYGFESFSQYSLVDVFVRRTCLWLLYIVISLTINCIEFIPDVS